ncbi:MAG: DUF86 domain-containing protein [Pseudolabrys sp.]|nr:DUF86 domain-containing protein [Pseudolabrys sp.]
MEAIDTVLSLLAGQTASELSKDTIRRMAIERGLEIICEASRHVPDAVKAQNVEIDWREMRDFGNVLRHAYHRVDLDRVLKIVTADLPPLRSFVEQVLREEQTP